MEKPEREEIMRTEAGAAASERLIMAPDGVNEADGPAKDEFGLPFEELDSLSDRPFEFEEMAAALWEDAQIVYTQSAKYNRFSPRYLDLLTRLEKIIRQLAGFCVTKAVMERKGFRFPKLEDLRVWHLYCMAAFHFRKCHEAFTKLRESGKGLDMTLLDWEFRWYAISERLRATEVRINRILAGKIKTDDLLDRAVTYWNGPVKPEQPKRAPGQPSAIPPVRSFPVIRSFSKALEAYHKEMERDQKRFLGGGFREPGIFNPVKLNDPAVYEKHLRQMMLNRAKAGNDKAAAEAIRHESLDELHERFKQYREAEARSEPAAIDPPPRTPGPSDAVRKKLREKRKKRK